MLKKHRDFDTEISELINAYLKDGLSARDTAEAVEREISPDKDMVLYLTRPGLFGVLYKLVTIEVQRINSRKNKQLKRQLRERKEAGAGPGTKHKSKQWNRGVELNLFDRYYYNRRLGDWTCGELLSHGYTEQRKAKTHMQYANLAVLLGKMGPADQVVRTLNKERVTGALYEVGLAEDDLPTEL